MIVSWVIMSGEACSVLFLVLNIYIFLWIVFYSLKPSKPEKTTLGASLLADLRTVVAPSYVWVCCTLS